MGFPGTRPCFFALTVIIFLFFIVPASAGFSFETERPIRVVMEQNYPPFSMPGEDGEMIGITIDQWRLWEKKTGIPVTITGLVWEEAMERMRAGEFDIIDTLFYTKERAEFLEFTEPYATIDVSIFFNRNISGISDIRSLTGFQVAAVTGDAAADYLKEHNISTTLYSSSEEIIRDAGRGDVVVFLMDKPTALYFLHKYQIQDSFRYSDPLYSGELRRAAQKDNHALVARVNEGFASISEKEFEEIQSRWYGSTVTSEEIFEFIRMIVFISAVIVCILILWIYLLRQTVRKKTREITKSEKAYKTLYNENPSMFYSVDREGIIRSVNEFGCRQLLYTKDELVGRPFETIIHPDDRKTTQEYLRQCIDTTGDVVTGVQRKVRKDGAVIWTRDRGRAVVQPDEEMVLFIVSVDITEQKNAEEQLAKNAEELRAAYEQASATEEELRQNYERIQRQEVELRESEVRYRDLVELLPLGVYELDREGRIVMANRMAKELFGITDDDIRSGLNIFSLISPKDHDLAAKNLLSILGGQYNRGNEYSVRKINGTEFKILSYGDAMMYDGNVIGYRGAFIDLTERKQTAEALQKAKTKLNLLNSIVFTDIQNAIFSLSGYLELEQEELTDENLRHYVDRQMLIVQNISDSLLFAKNYQNLGLKPPTWQKVTETFAFAVSHLDISHLSRSLAIRDLEIYADPMIENVFFTLAENVVLHGKTATEIRLWYRLSEDTLTLIFEDNGTGIAEKNKELIFERRFEKKKGMGLFLSREILSITGLSISETGMYGSGARFEIVIPKKAYRFTSGDKTG
ncbi:MAG: PAS domain S-box protein [Methanospirillaceae archaeon]|nr:PAS domain S-box protein [Methanospirillaceae archaeon]